MLSLYLSILSDQGSKDKFELIYKKYKNLMLNRAFDILDDRGLAEDAVHNAFMRILKNLDKIGEPDDKTTRGFVMVVVENAAKAIYNKEHKIKTVELFDIESNESVEEELDSRELYRSIEKNFKSLPEIYKMVVILKYYNDMDTKSIASALSLNVETVRKRLQRAQKLLYRSVKDGE